LNPELLRENASLRGAKIDENQDLIFEPNYG
jgi:hypothetical protein